MLHHKLTCQNILSLIVRNMEERQTYVGTFHTWPIHKVILCWKGIYGLGIMLWEASHNKKETGKSSKSIKLFSCVVKPFYTTIDFMRNKILRKIHI